MKDAPAGTCSVHNEDELRQEHDDTGALVSVCLKCPRKIKMCTATKYTGSCILRKGHDWQHKTYRGDLF